MKRFSLRARVTTLVGIVLFVMTGLLTAASIISAGNIFSSQHTVVSTISMTLGEADSLYDTGAPLPGHTFSISEAQREFSISNIIIMFILLTAGILIAYFIMGRALRPLSNLSEAIQDISENNLSTSIEVPPTKDEVGSLAVSFNAMLHRLNHSFARQKQFAASAAHELRTPLSTIKASFQVLHLDDHPKLEDYEVHAEATQQSIERLILVVDDLLKLTTEDLTDFQDQLMLQHAFEELAQELTAVATRMDVRVIVHQSDCSIKCNRTLLCRAIFNLIENAIKYNKPGGKVELFAETVEDFAIISVEDSGIGILEEELEYIFEPFYRVDPSRSRDTAGSGLGLALVKSIIQKHRGTVEITSQKGSGTLVKLIIPAR